MRMMKNNRNETIMVIGIDHGYGNMKTATSKKQKEAEKQLQSLKYQAEQSRKTAEKEVQKLKKE